MTVLGFFSAKGAPGATTTAMLVASLWPQPTLLVDCDPAGGDVALRLPAPDGRPLDPATGMLTLLPLARRALEPAALVAHTQQVLGGGEVVAGLSGPEQAAAAGPVWGAVADLLGAAPDRDVVLDLGRLDSRSPVLPLASAADLVVEVVPANVTGVVAARSRLRTLLPALTDREGRSPVVGLVVRSADEREAENAGALIQSEFPDVRWFGRVADDPAAARMFDGEAVSRPERTLLVRSGRELVATLGGALYVAQWQAPGETALPPAPPAAAPTTVAAADAPAVRATDGVGFREAASGEPGAAERGRCGQLRGGRRRHEGKRRA